MTTSTILNKRTNDKLDVITMIEEELINPDRFQLTLVRKEIDAKDFKFEQDLTYWLNPERMEKRATFDNKHYNQNQEIEIGWM